MTLAPDLVSPWSDRFVCVSLFGCFLDPLPPSFSLPALLSDLPWGLQGDDPKGREGPRERCPETSLTGTHSASELRKTRDRIKSPPLILSVPQPAYSLDPCSCLSLQLLSSPIFLASRFRLRLLRSSESGPSTFKPYDLKQSVSSESVSSSVK